LYQGNGPNYPADQCCCSSHGTKFQSTIIWLNETHTYLMNNLTQTNTDSDMATSKDPRLHTKEDISVPSTRTCLLIKDIDSYKSCYQSCVYIHTRKDTAVGKPDGYHARTYARRYISPVDYRSPDGSLSHGFDAVTLILCSTLWVTWRSDSGSRCR